MSPHTLFSAFTGLIFLGINCSVCLGAKDSELLPELADLQENMEPEDNKQNPQLMKVIQQYAPKMSDGKSNEKMRLEAAAAAAAAAAETMKKLREEDGPEAGEEQYLAKRLAKIQRGFGDFFKSRPGFRNWGGKRSKFNYGDKRTAFSRWGGKRSKFNNWGGKRGKTVGRMLLPNGDSLRMETDGREIYYFIQPFLNNFKEKPAEADKYGLEKRDPEFSVPYEQGGPEEDDVFKRNGFKTWAGKRLSDAAFDRSLTRLFLLLPWAGKMDVKQDESLKEFQKSFWDASSPVHKDEHLGDNSYSFRDSSDGDTGPEKIKFHSREDSR